NRHLDIIENVKKTFTGEPHDWISDIDGKKFHVRTVPIYDEKGEVSDIVGSIDDVTGIMELQEELTAVAAQLKAVVANYPGAICSANKDFNITLFDGLLVPHLIDKELFFAGQNLDTALQKEEYRHIMGRLRNTATEGAQDWSFEANGKVLHMTSTPIYGDTGEVTGLVAKIDDVTEMTRIQKELQTALEQAEAAVQALEMAQCTTTTMFESNPHINILFNDRFQLIDCNLAAVEFFGLRSKEELLAELVERITKSVPMYQPDGRASIPLVERLITAVKEGAVKFETKLVMGEMIRNLDVVFKKIPYQGSFAIVGYVYDMTEIYERELELARAQEEAERQRSKAEAANNAKSSFLSTMSHEIRTPMNAILGITEILMQNDNLELPMRDSLEKIYASGDLLLSIINDILDISKIEAGKMDLNIDKYEVASLVSDTALLNMMRIGSKPIEFELQVDENLPFALSGDVLRVKQILNNLLSNAFKYTAEGNVKLLVSSETVDDKNDQVMLVVRVSDTGQGMSKEQVDKLFDEYTRFNTEANRSTEGTGLGMSITQNLVRLMRGEILVKSEPGNGTEITVKLPQGRNGNEVLGREMVENLQQFRSNSSRAQMRRVQITREPMPYGNVLIVDDVETNIYVAKGLLSPYELKVDSASSGMAAIEKIKKGNFYDIVFMDHMMPKMDGIEATKIIRGLGYERPIVALTANAVSGQADMFLKNGFDDYISKPIDIRQLNTILNKLIRDKQPPEVLLAARQATQKENQTPDNVPSAIDSQFTKVFVYDASKTLAVLEPIAQNNDYGNAENMRAYIIYVHGMKSATAVMGNMELSDTAGKLEAAAREGRLDLLTSETPAFIRSLRAFAEALTPSEDDADGEMSDEDQSRLREKLLLIKTACEEYDESTVDETLRDLNKTAWPKPVRELLSKIAECLLFSDFDKIVAMIDEMDAGKN
ncbi:MAG: ATP-binding protein, partial [Planctomycetaceae bacterium]|nr:ATP-binding protein [Planctomycetaceae bacterium]